MSEILPLLSNAWSLFLVILFFGGSIFVHELGHFLAARRRGAHVERFSIGFGPAIWSRRGKDGVEYRISWIPLGGYVLLPQLADLGAVEGESTTDVKKLPPIPYGSKMLILVAGAAFNVIFAFVLSTVLWTIGTPVIEEEQTTRIGFVRETIELPTGKATEGPAYRAKLKSGDVVVSVDGKSVKSFSDINQLVALGHGRSASGAPSVDLEFEREGRRQQVTLNPILVGEGSDVFREIGIEPAAKVTVAGVLPGSPAEAVGLKFRDIITHVDGQPINYVGYLSDYFRTNGAKSVHLTLLRENQKVELDVAPAKFTDPEKKTEGYRLGVSLRGALTPKMIHTTPWEQVWDKAVWTGRNLQSLVNTNSDVGLNKMSSPLGIGSRMYQLAQVDFRLLLWFVIFVNVNLAIFNLLPIPVLDGGQMLFATIGRLRNRELPANFIIATQSAFFVLLMSMILYVGFFDVKRLSRDAKADRPAQPATGTAPSLTAPAPKAGEPAVVPAPAPAGK